MPTLKKRINLTIDDTVFNDLKLISKKEGSSVASVSYALLEKALELKEDLYFSNIGEERISTKFKKIKHKDIWD